VLDIKILIVIFNFIPFLVHGEESFFFTFIGQPLGERIEKGKLHAVVPIKKVDPPEALSIVAYHQGLGVGREYKIQVNLKSKPEKGWMPILNLDGEIILRGISVSRTDDSGFVSSFSLEGDDLELISS